MLGAGRTLTRPGRVFVVGEVAQSHDGSLGQAHAFVDAIADAGADAVKFQTHIAAAESTPGEPWRVAFSRQDESRYEYWQRMEFSESQWRGLQEHATDRGLVFLSSPFSDEARTLLDRVGVGAWKVASGEVPDTGFVERLAADGRPVILSTGLATDDELDAAIDAVRRAGGEVVVLQCTTSYPCEPERIGLNLMQELAARYGCPVGLSDHSGTIFPSLTAAALGASLVEVHVTLSRRMFGPDVIASITVEELAQLVEGIRFVERMLGNPVDRDEYLAGAADVRQLFTKSVVAARDLEVGARLGPGDLVCRKPGGGLPPHALSALLGRTLARPVERNTPLSNDDLVPS